MPERFNQTLLNMIGTLEDDKKSNWKTHLPVLVHAYNSTQHSTTGFTPHFLMFGRHPRLAIDAFLGIEPSPTKHSNVSSYITGLRSRLNFAYKVASREARKQARRYKQRYDLKVREAELQVGDRVLVRNVGIRGKAKLADRWERDVHLVVAQPTPGIPIYEVRREHGKSKSRLLHRNLLLPFTGIPLQKPVVPKTVITSTDPLDSSVHSVDSNTSQQESRSTSQNNVLDSENSRSSCNFSSSVSGLRYVIPARRGSRVDHVGTANNQPRQGRNRTKPAWMRTGSWVT